jgi:hypothetical protein
MHAIKGIKPYCDEVALQTPKLACTAVAYKTTTAVAQLITVCMTPHAKV